METEDRLLVALEHYLTARGGEIDAMRKMGARLAQREAILESIKGQSSKAKAFATKVEDIGLGRRIDEAHEFKTVALARLWEAMK